ncbi:MAG: NosD domain-containing protein [Thermoproteota archaeon]
MHGRADRPFLHVNQRHCFINCIYLSSTFDAIIINCEVYNNSYSGIKLKDGEASFLGMKLRFPPTNNTLIVNCKAYNNYEGISLLYSTNNVIKDCELYGNSYGIRLLLSHNNTVTGCIIRNNQIGVKLDFAKDNLIYNNFFNNTKILVHGNFTLKAKNCEAFGAMFYPSKWNIEKHEGKNIVGGKYIGGNYWDDYNGTDIDDDGVGDRPYVIDEYSMDNYPLIKPKVLVEEEGKPSMWAIYSVPIILVSIIAAYLLIKHRR